MTADTYEAKMQLALSANAAGKFDETLMLLQEASEYEQATGIPHFLMAAVLAQSGQLEQAEAAYANALLLSPELATARFQLGLLQLTSGRAAMSMLTWQPLLGLPPDDPIRSYVLGYMALTHDRFQEAVEHFNAGLSLPQTNEALAGDIRNTIQAIAQQRDLNPAPVNPADASEESKNTDHFLLSNYRSSQDSH